MSVSNEVMLEGAVDDSYRFLKNLNSEGQDLTPMVYLFEENDPHPFLVMGLPPQEDDQSSKVVSHMMLLPFMNLLPTEAVVVVQDTWFLKAENEDDTIDLENTVRPSQNIDRKQGLSSIQMRKDFSGMFGVKEYGRDDTGNLYTKETTNSAIPNFLDKENEVVNSWLVDILVQGFKSLDTKKALIEDKPDELSDDDVYLMTLMQGMSACTRMGYNFAVRDDFGEWIIRKYPNANNDLIEFFTNFKEENERMNREMFGEDE